MLTADQFVGRDDGLLQITMRICGFVVHTTAVNSFQPGLKYTWEIPDNSLAFLDIKVPVEGISVHYKPTYSHSYLLYSHYQLS